MYLTARALYVIAFDLHTYEDKDFESAILFFLRSLQLRVADEARLLIVGTHADLLSSTSEIHAKCKRVGDRIRAWDDQEIAVLREQIDALEGNIKPLEKDFDKRDSKIDTDQTLNRLRAERDRLIHCLKKRVKVPRAVYPVSSADRLYGMEDFRQAIEATALNKKAFPQIGEKIPIVRFSLLFFHNPFCDALKMKILVCLALI
jgi:hypothetical protein